MDVVANRGLERIVRLVGRRPPARSVLHPIALAGDLIANSAFYALVGLGEPRRAPLRGVLLGTAAGIGALVLAPRLGLGTPPHSHERHNQLLTVTWYLAGGLVAGTVARHLARRGERRAGVRRDDQHDERRDAARSQRMPWYRFGRSAKVHGDDLGDAIPTAPLGTYVTP
jgi:hypothetical protein